MPNQSLIPSFYSESELKELLAELEVPFPPHQVQWRVTNTANDKKRGQMMPYANPRAYTDRLNALLSPRRWTRAYQIDTLNHVPRVKNGESILTGKVLVTCTVTLHDIGSHAGTGEGWADDYNGLTSADAQAFKRACACFGLGRYFYDVAPLWVDLDQNCQPLAIPMLPAWAMPANWRKGMRPNGTNHDHKESPIPGNGNRDPDLDARIFAMKSFVGNDLYRNVLREHGRANQPRRIEDIRAKLKVLQVLESASRGLERMNAITKRLDPKTVEALLTALQAPPAGKISDMKTLQAVVFGLEKLAEH